MLVFLRCGARELYTSKKKKKKKRNYVTTLHFALDCYSLLTWLSHSINSMMLVVLYVLLHTISIEQNATRLTERKITVIHIKENENELSIWTKCTKKSARFEWISLSVGSGEGGYSMFFSVYFSIALNQSKAKHTIAAWCESRGNYSSYVISPSFDAHISLTPIPDLCWKVA